MTDVMINKEVEAFLFREAGSVWLCSMNDRRDDPIHRPGNHHGEQDTDFLPYKDAVRVDLDAAADDQEAPVAQPWY